MPHRFDRRCSFAQLALALAFSLVPTGVRAGPATTTLSVDVVGRYGPAGAMVVSGLARRWMADDGATPLAQGRYVQVGAAAGVSPAYGQGALTAEWVPIAVLQLRSEYDLYGFFGANGSLLTLPSKDARFGQGELRARAGSEETGVGHRVLLSPVLRAKLGPLVLRTQADLAWYALSSRPGWYYESEYDTLVARSDWIVANRTAVLADLWDGPAGATLLAGPMYDVTRSGAAAISRQRVGAAAFFAPAGAWWPGLDRIRLYALGGVNLSDRNRRGEPFALLGVGGDVDLGRDDARATSSR